MGCGAENSCRLKYVTELDMGQQKEEECGLNISQSLGSI